MFNNLLKAFLLGLAGSEKSYVVRGAVLRCNQGTHPGILNLPSCHGVYIKDKPLLNIADHEPVTNISTFGFCKMTPDRVCRPAFCSKWTEGKEDVLIDGEPALLNKSKLVCMNGGVISIEHDGQD